MSFSRRLTHLSHIKRYREIGNVMIKHGFGFLFDRISLQRITGRWITVGRQANQSIETPVRFRYALEELGPTFIKLGQLLSIRPDLLGPEYIKELEKLQDNVPPIDFAEVAGTCRDSGLDLIQNFHHIEHTPLAAASIAQVHRGQLQSGQRVVVKVQRPRISEIIGTDLLILADMGKWLERHTAWAKLYRLSDIIAELSTAVMLELDFIQEGQNAEKFSQYYRHDSNVIVPRIYWEYSSARVLTMEYVPGIKISDLSGLKNAGLNCDQVARNLLAALFNQIYIHGFFHADPHPGNIAIGPKGEIIFYDFGQVGIINEIMRDRCIDLLLSMVRYDVEGVTRALLAIGVRSQYVDLDELKRDVARLKNKYYGMPMAQIELGKSLAELLEISTRYQVRIPSELSLLVKMLMTIESLVANLDPTISIVNIAEPYGRRVLLHRYTPDKILHRIQETALDYSRLLRKLPYDLERLIGLFSEGELKVKMEDINLNRMMAKFDVMSNRISLAMIVASIIVGTSVISGKIETGLISRIPVMEVGFITAMILGFFLAYSIVKSGRF